MQDGCEEDNARNTAEDKDNRSHGQSVRPSRGTQRVRHPFPRLSAPTDAHSRRYISTDAYTFEPASPGPAAFASEKASRQSLRVDRRSGEMRLEEGGGEVQGEGEMVISCYGIVGYITLATSESFEPGSDRRQREEAERSEKAPQARGAERPRAKRESVRCSREISEAVVGRPSIAVRSSAASVSGPRERHRRRSVVHQSVAGINLRKRVGCTRILPQV